MKRCGRCMTEKSVEDFHRSKKSKDGRQGRCKTCQKALNSTPGMAEKRKRHAWLACLKKFGITEDEYMKMFDVQNGVCAICHRPELDVKLAVDHDHRTLKVRGLLCKRCNMGIGLLGDNHETVMTASLYLRRAQIG